MTTKGTWSARGIAITIGLWCLAATMTWWLPALHLAAAVAVVVTLTVIGVMITIRCKGNAALLPTFIPVLMIALQIGVTNGGMAGLILASVTAGPWLLASQCDKPS